jgi:hypothetical protein
LEQSASAIVRFRDDFINQMFDCPHLVSTARHHTETIRFLEKQIKDIESEVIVYPRNWENFGIAYFADFYTDGKTNQEDYPIQQPGKGACAP